MFFFWYLDDAVIVEPDWPFYCPQTIPDYTINYTVTPQFTLVNYCPQTIPDYSFAQAP